MTAVPPLPQPQVRPAWATALGLLGILIASDNLIYAGRSLVSLLSNTLPELLTVSDPALRASVQGTYLTTACMRIGGGLLLLAGAILLLKRRKSARTVFIIYLVLVWLGYLVSIGGRFLSLAFLGNHPYAVESIVNGFLNLLDPYPLFYLIWFFRPTIAREMARWQ